MTYEKLLKQQQVNYHMIALFVEQHKEIFEQYNRLHFEKDRIGRKLKEAYSADHPEAFKHKKPPVCLNEGRPWGGARRKLKLHLYT